MEMVVFRNIQKQIKKINQEVHEGVVEDVAWNLRHEYLFGSVGDDQQLLIWDLRSPNANRPVQSVVALESELTLKLSFQIEVHAFLLWASFGFLMSVCILMIIMSQRIECAHKVNVVFYSHVIIQILAVLLATIAVILSIKKFENTFGNTHQKIGLSLYAL